MKRSGEEEEEETGLVNKGSSRNRKKPYIVAGGCE